MEISKLSSVCKIFGGYAFPSTSYVESEVPLIRISNVKSNNEVVIDKSVSIKFEERFSNYVIQKQDILIALSGATTGKFGIYDSDEISYLNQRVGLLRANENINQRYLFYYLNLIQDEILRKAGGAAQPNISTTQLGEFQIPLPPLATQKAIAEKLDKADALRKKDKELLKQYDELAQSIFIDMFGDPVQNEKGWEKETLSEIGTIARGKSKHRPRNAPELLGGEYPLIQTGDIANSGLYLETFTSTYSELGLKQSKMWEKGTLCITIAANIAKTSILKINACFPDSIVGFIPNEKTNVIFIYYWFSFFQKILEEQAPESAQKNINLEILSKLQIILPNLQLQNQFAEKIKNIEAQKELVKKQAEASENLFQALLQESFNFT